MRSAAGPAVLASMNVAAGVASGRRPMRAAGKGRAAAPPPWFPPLEPPFRGAPLSKESPRGETHPAPCALQRARSLWGSRAGHGPRPARSGSRPLLRRSPGRPRAPLAPRPPPGRARWSRGRSKEPPTRNAPAVSPPAAVNRRDRGRLAPIHGGRPTWPAGATNVAAPRSPRRVAVLAPAALPLARGPGMPRSSGRRRATAQTRRHAACWSSGSSTRPTPACASNARRRSRVLRAPLLPKPGKRWGLRKAKVGCSGPDRPEWTRQDGLQRAIPDRRG